MHANEELIHRFYKAFADRDHETMAACYHKAVKFSDPVFPDLQGPAPGAMWRMLCERATDLVIEHSDVRADDTTGSAHWEAHYTFTATGRKVHNKIDASFRFQDGLITHHDDVFDFYAWSKQALGAMGFLLGWTGMVRNKVRGQAGGQLTRFMDKNDIG